MTAEVPHSQVYIDNSLHLVAVTLLFYDHIITFDDEYRQIWRTPRSGSNTLFLLHRHFAFMVNISVAYGNLGKFNSLESCSHYGFYRQLALILTQTFVAAVQFLRTFALYGKRLQIAVLILSVGAGVVGVSVWSVIGQPKSEVSLFEGCHLTSASTSAVRIAVAWEALFTFDTMIFFLTLYKTWRGRFHYRAARRRINLISLIFRDGAIYFGVMAIAQGANVITFYVCPPLLRGVLSTLASAISVTMMSRLMLNLRRTATQHSDVFSSTLDTAGVSSASLQFRDQVEATELRSFTDTAAESSENQATMSHNWLSKGKRVIRDWRPHSQYDLAIGA